MFLGPNIIGKVNKEIICYVCKLKSLGQPITLFKKLNNKLIKRKRIIKKVINSNESCISLHKNSRFSIWKKISCAIHKIHTLNIMIKKRVENIHHVYMAKIKLL